MSKKELDIFDYLLEENKENENNGAESINNLDEGTILAIQKMEEQKRASEEKKASRLKEPNRNKQQPVSKKDQKDKKQKLENDVIIKDFKLWKLNNETVVKYWGNTHNLSEFFEEEEILNNGKQNCLEISDEKLRERMESSGYDELVKGHVIMGYIKDKNIISVSIDMKKKGNSTKIVPSFPIPHHILQTFISHAKYYASKELELHAEVYLDHNGCYEIVFPKQKVNKYWVKPESDVLIQMEKRLVLQIHSHHNMSEIPSSLDNQNEVVPNIIYVIVGRLHQYFPSIHARIYRGGSHHLVDLTKVFVSPFNIIGPLEQVEVVKSVIDGVYEI
ncbi:hypothetical protein V7183_04250 [Bacillus sp. JJ1127]|uniref:hypothetical protein n=1 Tax=Bacillus sp. JJ1127 TaxID=3122952 RepID=UPI002FFFD213